MNAALEHLVHLASQDTTAGQMDYLDQLTYDTVLLCAPPHTHQRVMATIHELVTEISTTRRQEATMTG